MSRSAGLLAQPPKSRATSERASAWRMVESFQKRSRRNLEKAAPDVLLDDQNGIHFNLRTLWQGGYADGGAGRVWLVKVLGHDFVYLRLVVQDGEEDVHFDDG